VEGAEKSLREKFPQMLKDYTTLKNSPIALKNLIHTECDTAFRGFSWFEIASVGYKD
jgi:hypothetical protein